MRWDSTIYIDKREISLKAPTYFIADIASNHDNDIERAKDLIWLSKEAGADAAKFQHFKANKIVSDYGFKNLGTKLSHQASWDKSIYETFEQFECDLEWVEELAKTAKEAKIDFFSTPYDAEAVRVLNNYALAYKIGSGDLTWIDFIEMVAKLDKPVILSSGASTIEDVERGVYAVARHNPKIILLQCNTNYTGTSENFQYINLRVLQTYAIRFPNMILGISDHTPGHTVVLGAIAMGASVVEKHFTDDNNREGPDHSFSMNPQSWREMVDRANELQSALGNGIKRIEENEADTVIAQRRSLRMACNKKAGNKLNGSDVECLRPAPENSLEPYKLADVVGKTLSVSKVEGDALYKTDFEEKIC